VKEFTEPCPDLKKIEGDKVSFQDLLKTVVENYTLYYQCSLKNDGWNDWYKRQKELYNQVK
jgi:DNA-binding transcriptional regulator YbjK